MKLRSRLILLLAAVAIATTVLVAARPGPASAHPLGNFTINHSTTIQVSETGIVVFRVLEYAEIPAFQVLQDLPTDADGYIPLDSWAADQAELLRTNMQLAVDGDDVSLTTQQVQSEIVEGDGGLSLLRVEATYSGDIPGDWKDASPRLQFTDTAYTDKIGWREVIARGGPGVELADSPLPAESSTRNLRTYPEAVVESPPDVREASFSFRPGIGLPSIVGTGAAPFDPDHETATKGNPDSTLGGFTDLIAQKELSFGFIIVALFTATAFGAIHALSPGHGKTVVAAYLVGSRGTLRQAALLALVVTATHTSSVYLLGFVTLYLSEYIVPEDLYPWMSLIAGGIILAMGLSLLVARLRATRVFSVRTWVSSSRLRRSPALAFASENGSMALAPSHSHAARPEHRAVTAGTPEHHDRDDMVEEPHEHGHDHHESDGGATSHSHGWGPAHSHEVPGADGERVTWQRLVGLGIFGGMIPCPSAIVVMLSAIALQRVGLGLVLIVAFSFGLATVLTAIGFLVVYAQRSDFLRRAMDRAESSGGLAATMVRLVPIFAAVLVTAAGLFITTRAAGQF